MTEPQTLYLQFEEGRRIPIQIRRQTTERSLHTDRELVELHGLVSATDEAAHQAISTALRDVDDRLVSAVDAAGEFAGKWCVSWNSYAESGGLHTYIVLLREAEELSLEALVVGGLELHPYEYRERVVGDGLAIWSKMVGTHDDVRELRAVLRAGGTVPVIRRGINDQPRAMRVGVADWSEWEDRVKFRLVLLDRAVDAGDHPELARIERENNRAALGFYMNFAEHLVELLIARGAVTPEEIAAAREAAAAQPVIVRHDFWHVQDIDLL